jgi:hypothetical protein
MQSLAIEPQHSCILHHVCKSKNIQLHPSGQVCLNNKSLPVDTAAALLRTLATQKLLMQFRDLQSNALLQRLPAAQAEHWEPPQSTSVSTPSTFTLLHEAAWAMRRTADTDMV